MNAPSGRSVTATGWPIGLKVCSIIAVLVFVLNVTAALAANTPQEQTHIDHVYSPGCNAVVFAQFPDLPDLFVGRQINVTDPSNGCKGQGWSLVLLQMDWATHRFQILRAILKTPVSILDGSARIDSAYDPYIAKFNGEYWVAFECAGKGIIGSATCIGPFDPHQSGMDISRTYVIVQGRSAVPNDKYRYSASDPKLLTFRNRLYLYWTAIKSWVPAGISGHQWLSIAVRGMELTQEAGGRRLLWGARGGGPADAYDPSRNVEVWGGDPSDVRSNQTADMMSIMSIGDVIYATAGVGGNTDSSPPPVTEPHPGCVVPDNKKEGCFRLAISWSTTPLGVHVFNNNLAPERILPANTQEYARLYKQPDGRLFIMGRFMKALPPTDLSRAVPEGIDFIPLPANSPIAEWMKRH